MLWRWGKVGILIYISQKELLKSVLWFRFYSHPQLWDDDFEQIRRKLLQQINPNLIIEPNWQNDKIDKMNQIKILQ